jgi:hypothetical protein
MRIPPGALAAVAKQLTKIPADSFTPIMFLVGPALWPQFTLIAILDEPGLRIFMYQHSVTRNYILVSEDLQVWGYEQKRHLYFPITLGVALDHVFRGMESLGGCPGIWWTAEARKIDALRMEKQKWN